MKHKIFFLIIILFVCIGIYGQNNILVTQTTVKINSMGTEELYFGFEEGDQIVFNYELIKGKDLKEIEIFEYPNASVFMDYKTTQVRDKIINVNRKAIYKFKFRNTAVGNRVCKVKIERIPASSDTKNFSTTVYWKTLHDTSFYTEQEKYLVKEEYIPKAIIPTTQYYINSGSNATFKGGKSRITFPVNIPNNTIEWYYQFSATRNKKEIDKTKAGFNLVGQLTKLIDKTGILEIGIDALTQPPGGNICDVYQLDYENSRLFESKEAYKYFIDGTRKNIKSGIVKLNGGAGETYYIGIKNPDSMNGIHVAIEVVAIVHEQEWGIRDVKKYNVKTWQEPFLKE